MHFFDNFTALREMPKPKLLGKAELNCLSKQTIPGHNSSNFRIGPILIVNSDFLFCF